MTPATPPKPSPSVQDVLARDFRVPIPETAQCVRHGSVRLTERPIDCHVCVYDLRAAVQHALRVNEWLDQWRQDMVAALVTP